MVSCICLLNGICGVFIIKYHGNFSHDNRFDSFPVGIGVMEIAVYEKHGIFSGREKRRIEA
jgi:hypothetical protein